MKFSTLNKPISLKRIATVLITLALLLFAFGSLALQIPFLLLLTGFITYPAQILAAEPLTHREQGLNILFSNGDIEFHFPPQAARILAATTTPAPFPK